MHRELAPTDWEVTAREETGWSAVEVPGLEAARRGVASSEGTAREETRWAVVRWEETATTSGHMNLAGGFAPVAVEVSCLAMVGWMVRAMAGEGPAGMVTVEAGSLAVGSMAPAREEAGFGLVGWAVVGLAAMGRAAAAWEVVVLAEVAK